jgi:hypothetical protein
VLRTRTAPTACRRVPTRRRRDSARPARPDPRSDRCRRDPQQAAESWEAGQELEEGFVDQIWLVDVGGVTAVLEDQRCGAGVGRRRCRGVVAGPELAVSARDEQGSGPLPGRPRPASPVRVVLEQRPVSGARGSLICGTRPRASISRPRRWDRVRHREALAGVRYAVLKEGAQVVAGEAVEAVRPDLVVDHLGVWSTVTMPRRRSGPNRS